MKMKQMPVDHLRKDACLIVLVAVSSKQHFRESFLKKEAKNYADSVKEESNPMVFLINLTNH